MHHNFITKTMLVQDELFRHYFVKNFREKFIEMANIKEY